MKRHDGDTAAYVYGNGRIAQVGTGTEYFLGDALGSVRQLTNPSGSVTYARVYDPYGVVTAGAGSSQSAYGYTNEYTSQGFVYLRSRYYAPQSGRFMTRDTWSGNVNSPMSFNRWNYVNANPINMIDPTGMTPLIPCPNENDPECILKVNELKSEALRIKSDVTSGNLLPVEGFAQFLDATMLKFDNDLGATMWASTLIINGFDSSSSFIWLQALLDNHEGYAYWIGFDWLPYKDASCKDIERYYGPVRDWICSERGDWKTEYWDKTANQAYHGWFSAATTFFHGKSWAKFANDYHEGSNLEPINLDELTTPPPVSGNTVQDYALSLKMMELGYMLSLHYIDSLAYQFPGQCPPDNSNLPKDLRYMSPGNWIRSNLTEPSVQ